MQPFVSKCSLSFSLRCCVMRESLSGPLCLSFGWFLPSCCSYWFLAGEKKKKASISLHLYDDHHHHTTLLLWLLELETRAHSNVMERSWWRPSKKMWKPRSQVDPVRPASVFRPHGVKSIKLLKLLRHEVFGGQGHLEVIAVFLKCISFPLPGWINLCTLLNMLTHTDTHSSGYP